MAATGEYTIADLAEVFTVSRATVYRTSSDPRQQARPGKPDLPPPRGLGTASRGSRICTASALPLIPARFFPGPRWCLNGSVT